MKKKIAKTIYKTKLHLENLRSKTVTRIANLATRLDLGGRKQKEKESKK